MFSCLHLNIISTFHLILSNYACSGKEFESELESVLGRSDMHIISATYHLLLLPLSLMPDSCFYYLSLLDRTILKVALTPLECPDQQEPNVLSGETVTDKGQYERLKI